MRKDAVIVVRLPGEVKAALRRAAAEDERTLSAEVAWVLKEWVIRRGYLAAGPRKGRA